MIYTRATNNFHAEFLIKMFRQKISSKDEIIMCNLEDNKIQQDEMIFEFKNSRLDLVSPEILVEKKKKPHHAKRRKGWER